MNSQSAGNYIKLLWISFSIFAGVSLAYSQDRSDKNSGIHYLWARQSEIFQNGADFQEFDDVKNEIRRFLLKNGALRSPQISASYVVLGYQAIENNRRKDAQWAFQAALEMDSRNARASKALLANTLHLGFSEILTAVPIGFKTALQRVSAPGTRHLIIGNTALGFVYAFIIFAVWIVIITAFRQSGLFVNDLLRVIPFASDARFVSAALFLGIIALAATPVGIPGIVLIAFTAAFLYAEKHQLRILWTAWILVALVFPFSMLHVQSVLLESNPEFRVLRYALDGGYSEPVMSEIDNLLHQNADDESSAKLLFIRGLINKRGGFYNDAVEDLSRYESLNRRDAGVYINLGNIEYINDNVQSAIAYYRRAESIEPHNPVIFYNLSKAYLSIFRFDEARSMQNRANELNESLVNRLNEKYSQDLVRMVADSGISVEWLGEEARKTWKTALDQTITDWTIPFFKVPLRRALVGWIVLTVLAIGLQYISRKLSFSRYCIKCRTAMKPDSDATSADKICVDCCLLFFGRTKTTDQNKKAIKRKQAIKRIFWTRMIHVLLSTIIPGAGRMYSGYVLSGPVMMFIWSVVIGNILAGRHTVRTYYQIPSEAAFSSGVCTITVLIVLYLISIVWSFTEDDI
jgi:tetratricopeptide (TPR) repeat protein